jgi:hypothetical protein
LRAVAVAVFFTAQAAAQADTVVLLVAKQRVVVVPRNKILQ